MKGAARTLTRHGDARFCAPLQVAGVQPQTGWCGVGHVTSVGARNRNFKLAGRRIQRRQTQDRDNPGSHADATKRDDVPIRNLELMSGLAFCPRRPMRIRANMRVTAEGIDPMGRQEAGNWFGMLMRLKHSRPMPTALRCLLTNPGW